MVLLSETFPGRLTAQNGLISTERPRLSALPRLWKRTEPERIPHRPWRVHAARGPPGARREVAGTKRAQASLGLRLRPRPRVEWRGSHAHTLYRSLETYEWEFEHGWEEQAMQTASYPVYPGLPNRGAWRVGQPGPLPSCLASN